MLVTSKELMLDAQKNGYAIGAFNVENMEMVQAVIAAAEELRSPVIMQTTPSTLKYADADYFYANVACAAKKASVPVVMHLDHGNSFELAVKAFRAGYTSIMIDGSHSIFEENIAVKRVIEKCGFKFYSIGEYKEYKTTNYILFNYYKRNNCHCELCLNPTTCLCKLCPNHDFCLINKPVSCKFKVN